MFELCQIGAAVPQLKLADCISNKEKSQTIHEANEKSVC